MIITGDNVDGIATLKYDLAHCFEMKDLGHLSYFLGIEVSSSPRGYLFTQSKYATNFIERARLTDTKIADNPLETNVRYSPSHGIPLPILNLYRTIVGSLVYLTITRPDIAYAVHIFSQFVSALTIVHWGAVRILRYLYGYREMHVIFWKLLEMLGPFLLGAQNGISEIVKEILKSFPHSITFLDEENHSVFHLAAMYRHEKIFKIVHQQSEQFKISLSLLLDNRRNNILHLVGYKGCQDRLDLNPGAVLQMQRELQWYKEVEKFVLPQERKSKNSDGKTPLTIFNEKHHELVAHETQWIYLEAGGNNSNGLPIFSNRKSFIVFAVSDALALLSSITTVISFLSIFTSRYAVNDFLYALPNRLIIGLISLFLSVASLMIAFSSTIFLVVSQKNDVILIPIIILACVPVTLFTYLQLPPLLNMIKSTHGPSIFG
ncbi:Ankyrin repeat family protein [Abeliophyllum distichum]|uniref:Ankyrin repeat family protein n=1 Tax=Abeliophyllum distichum TaxID=126358 RepID=A0ABD1V7L9_9LAMI